VRYIPPSFVLDTGPPTPRLTTDSVVTAGKKPTTVEMLGAASIAGIAGGIAGNPAGQYEFTSSAQGARQRLASGTGHV
jgi:hypothetical protein